MSLDAFNDLDINGRALLRLLSLRMLIIVMLLVMPHSRRYGDVMATYIREVKTPSRVR